MPTACEVPPEVALWPFATCTSDVSPLLTERAVGTPAVPLCSASGPLALGKLCAEPVWKVVGFSRCLRWLWPYKIGDEFFAHYLGRVRRVQRGPIQQGNA